MALLELQSATKAFGALTVVDDLSLAVDAGEVLGIIGPNGAGKTTALSLIGGELRLTSGRVVLDGEDLTHAAVQLRCRRGIARTFQVPQPFGRLTVFENVLVGALHGRAKRRAAQDAALDALATARLVDQANALAGSLTLLERKRLELARTIVMAPRVVLLDESAGGLTDGEVEQLLPTIRDLRDGGTAIIWIEHVLHALVAVADRVVCVDRGRELVSGRPDEVMASAAVQDVYLGTGV